MPAVLRYGSFLLPSLLIHGAILGALTSVHSGKEPSLRSLADTAQYVVITEVGGGRVGDDRQIGDAPKTIDPDPVRFKQVTPKAKPKNTKKPLVEPVAEAMSQGEDVQDASSASNEGPGSEGSVQHGGSISTVSGSAGRDPFATTSGSGVGGEGVDRRAALRAWLRQIQREVNKLAARNYPRTAVRMGLEGRLRLGLTIDEKGTIRNVRVLKSSGHSVLDDSASSSVMQIHLPPPPPELGWREREISLPIRYSLD